MSRYLPRSGRRSLTAGRPGDYVLDWSQFFFNSRQFRVALKADIDSWTTHDRYFQTRPRSARALLIIRPGLQEITVKMYESFYSKMGHTAWCCLLFAPIGPTKIAFCRKPKTPVCCKPQADDFNIDLSRSIFIGDSDTDVQAWPGRRLCVSVVRPRIVVRSRRLQNGSVY